VSVVITRQAASSAVIVRLDRAIQYSAADVFCIERLRLLDTRFRGYDERGAAAEWKPTAFDEVADV
jgi:hypothetical protein